MEPLRVVKFEILIQCASDFSDRTVVVEIYFLIFDRSPQALDKDVVKDAAPAVHADGDPTSFQPVRELGAGELAALICVEDLRLGTTQGLIKCHDAEIFLQADGQFPREHIAGKPVHYRDQVNEAADHPDIRDISAPDAITAIDYMVTEKVWVDPMLFAPLAQSRLRMNRFKSHEPHETGDSFRVDPIALSSKPCRHPRNTVEGPLGVLLIDKPHQEKIQLALGPCSVVVRAPGKSQHFTLPPNGYLRMTRIDQHPFRFNGAFQIFF
jgi:hypothetical protein